MIYKEFASYAMSPPPLHLPATSESPPWRAAGRGKRNREFIEAAIYFCFPCSLAASLLPQASHAKVLRCCYGC